MALVFEFTHHAVDQYVKRHARGVPYEEARSQLEVAAVGAVRLKEKTHSGQQKWRIEALDLVFVTKRDQEKYICVTVLPHAAFERMTLEALSDLEDEAAVLTAREEKIHSERAKIQEQLENPAPPPPPKKFEVRLQEAVRAEHHKKARP